MNAFEDLILSVPNLCILQEKIVCKENETQKRNTKLCTIPKGLKERLKAEQLIYNLRNKTDFFRNKWTTSK